MRSVKGQAPLLHCRMPRRRGTPESAAAPVYADRYARASVGGASHPTSILASRLPALFGSQPPYKPGKSDANTCSRAG